MKKVLILITSFMVLVLAACGDIDEKNTREVSKGNTAADAATEQESEKAETAEKEEVEKEKPIGTRSNPLPFGDLIKVKENIYDDNFNSYNATLEIGLKEVIRGDEAWSIILKENQFNEKPADGYEYMLVKVTGKMVEAGTEDDSLYFSSMSFKFVSDDGDVYEMTSAVIPNELTKELYNGGSAEGYIVNQVRVGDDVKVSYDSSEGSPVFFYLH